MRDFLPYLLAVFMVATLVALLVGLVGFAENAKSNAKNGNRLMRARVVLQGLSIATFLLIVALSAA